MGKAPGEPEPGTGPEADTSAAERALVAALGAGEADERRVVGGLRAGVEQLAAPSAPGTVGAVTDFDLLVGLLALGSWPVAPEPGEPWAALERRIAAATGRPGGELARLLRELVAAAAADARVAERGTHRDLYDEACEVYDAWEFLLADAEPREADVRSYRREVEFADSALSRFHDLDGDLEHFAWTEAWRLARELGEALARDGAGAPLEFGGYKYVALGWPALFGHLAFRLRELVAAAVSDGVAPVRVESAAGTERVVPLPEFGAYQLSLWLLDACGDALGSGSARRTLIGADRIRRTLPWPVLSVARLQLESLLAELTTGTVAVPAQVPARYGLVGATEFARVVDEVCGHLAAVSEPSQRMAPSGVELPYSAWEVRAMFPVLPGFLEYDRKAGRDITSGGEHPHDGETRVAFVVSAYLSRIGARSRAACALIGELAALDLLFPRDAELHQALGLLGGGPPRESDPEVGFWDELNWRAWLREAGAALSGGVRAAGRRPS